MAGHMSALASFVESAPPGELTDVSNAIKNIFSHDSRVIESLEPAFERYHRDQFTEVILPGTDQRTIVSSYNTLGNGRYYDVERQTSFVFDHVTQRASDVQSHVLDHDQIDLIKSLHRSLSSHVKEHYPSASLGVYPVEGGSIIAILVVANKYSSTNFWNGRWRSIYLLNTSSNSLEGSLKVDVHYYEDGNVRLLTEKKFSAAFSAPASTSEITKLIAVNERRYQEDINNAFSHLCEGAFKGLRRQLPVTRQKIEWEKISGYRLGQDIGGGRSK